MLIVGCGDVGLRIVRQTHAHLAVIAVNRAPSADARAAGARATVWDLDARSHARAGRKNIAAIADWAIYLTPPPNQGKGDPRLKRFLAAWRTTNSNKRLAYVSTSGVYGNCAGAWVTEARPANPDSDRGKRRVEAEHLVRLAGKGGNMRATLLRAPGIYAATRLPIERLKAGTPALMAAQDVYTNHIHADDLARICITALLRGRASRVYNASDDSHMKMADYFDAVAHAFNLPRAPRLPAEELKAAVSPMMWSFMRESRRLVNARLKKELRFRFAYPTVREGIAAAQVFLSAQKQE
ncbi:MAG: SDR family oxidoreductase [Burkholderiaceae bacterium]